MQHQLSRGPLDLRGHSAREHYHQVCHAPRTSLRVILSFPSLDQGTFKAQNCVANSLQPTFTTPRVFQFSPNFNTLRVFFFVFVFPPGYYSCIYAAGLAPDLQILPGGDQVTIGSFGIRLSGGQRARVALARAAYMEARWVQKCVNY